MGQVGTAAARKNNSEHVPMSVSRKTASPTKRHHQHQRQHQLRRQHRRRQWSRERAEQWRIARVDPTSRRPSIRWRRQLLLRPTQHLQQISKLFPAKMRVLTSVSSSPWLHCSSPSLPYRRWSSTSTGATTASRTLPSNTFATEQAKLHLVRNRRWDLLPFLSSRSITPSWRHTTIWTSRPFQCGCIS